MRQTTLFGIGLTALLILAGCAGSTDSIDVSAYDYRDTKNLVRFVEHAVRQIERAGLSALEQLPEQSLQPAGCYLYVYDMEDNCLHHAGMPELAGRRLTDVRDVEGRPISALVREALDNPENPHGWVHYTWWAPGKFYPVPKSSCHFRARLPDGRDVYVGGGLDNPHEEREFVRIAVDSAVNLIKARGADAIPMIADPLSAHNYRDVRVFAFRPDGRMLISPVLGESRIDMDLRACVDESGSRPFDRAMLLLQNQPYVWQVFIDRNRDERQPMKKTLYLRQTVLDNEPVHLGAITDLPHPP